MEGKKSIKTPSMSTSKSSSIKPPSKSSLKNPQSSTTTATSNIEKKTVPKSTTTRTTTTSSLKKPIKSSSTIKPTSIQKEINTEENGIIELSTNNNNNNNNNNIIEEQLNVIEEIHYEPEITTTTSTVITTLDNIDNNEDDIVQCKEIEDILPITSKSTTVNISENNSGIKKKATTTTTTTTTKKITTTSSSKLVVSSKPTTSTTSITKPNSLKLPKQSSIKVPSKSTTTTIKQPIKTPTPTKIIKVTEPLKSTAIKSTQNTDSSTPTTTATKKTTTLSTKPKESLSKKAAPTSKTGVVPQTIVSKTTTVIPSKPKETLKTPSKVITSVTIKTATTPLKPKESTLKTPSKPTTATTSKTPTKTTTTTTTSKTPVTTKTTSISKTPTKTTTIAIKAPTKTTTTTTTSKTPVTTKTTSISKTPTKTTSSTSITKTPTKTTSSNKTPIQTTTTPTKSNNTTTKTISTPNSKLPIKSTTPLKSPTKSILDDLNNNNPTTTLKSINKPMGPNRRKPTVNPVKNLQNLPASSNTTNNNNNSSKSKTNMNSIVSGFGLLASVGVSASSRSSEDILSEFKNMKLNKTASESSLLDNIRLIKCSGRKNIIPRKVELSNHVFRSNCCFILDTPNKIYEWRGSKSNKIQITKAMDLANRIKNKERSGRPVVLVIEELKKSQFDDEFWSLIPNGKPQDKDISEEPDDKVKIKDILYKMVLNEQGNEISLVKQVIEGKSQKLYKELLIEDNEFTFILDSWSEVYVWIGKQTNPFIKKMSMEVAKDLTKNRKGRPSWVKPMKISEGTEIELFKEKFFNWCSSLPIAMGSTGKGRVAQVITQDEFKVSTMIDQWTSSPPLYITKSIDDGKGTVQIWRVKDHTKESIPIEMYGHFYEGESYVILYKYQQRNKDNYIIYFWQGKKSTINEKGSSALLTVDLDDSIGGIATQIRVVQNKEPIHFFKIFKGFIVIHKGLMDDDSNEKTKLYHIKFCNIINDNISFRIIESNELSIKNLNSNDYFILEEKEKLKEKLIENGDEEINVVEIENLNFQNIYVWKGKYSCNIINIEKEIQNIIKLIYGGSSEKKKNIVIIEEEVNETKEFIELFENDVEEINNSNGIIDHSNNYILEKVPKLYQCSLSSGIFKVERIFEFDQDDLDQDDTMILDVGDFILLWIGKSSTQDERLQSMKVVIQYSNLLSTMKKDQFEKENQILLDGADLIEQPSTIDLSINCFLIQSTLEPRVFRRYFHCWNENKTQIHNPECEELILVSDYLAQLDRTYTLEELQNPPKFLDKSRLEQYLSDQDFQLAFKMSKSNFDNQKLWKQEQLKKTLGIY